MKRTPLSSRASRRAVAGVRGFLLSTSFLTAVSLITVAAGAFPLEAQQNQSERPAESRVDYSAFADSVDELESRGSLLALLDPPAASPARDPAATIQRGLILHRLYEITGEDRHAEQAKEELKALVERNPSLAWGHYVLALARAGGPEIRLWNVDRIVMFQSLAEAAGLDPVSRARESLRRALELDPRFDRAAMLLGHLALRDPTQDHLREASSALERAREDGASSELQLLLSDVQGALGDVSGAARAASGALAADRSDPLALRASAAALLREPETRQQGAAAYFGGVDRLTGDAAERYYEDLAMIANEADQRQWEASDLEERRNWLREFWESRAALAGVSTEERLAEHYRRLALARRHFWRQARRGAASISAVERERLDERRIDDRGVLLIRHGEPREVIRTLGRDTRNETWVYTTPGGASRMYHFALPIGAGGGYVITGIPPCDPGWLADRARYDGRYRLLAMRCEEAAASLDNQRELAHSARGLEMDLDSEAREAAREAMRTDSYTPNFENALPFHYDVHTFRGNDDRSDVMAAVAVPAELLTAQANENGGVRYSLDVTFVVMDTVTGPAASRDIARVDTVRHLVAPAELSPGDYLRTYVEIDAVPSGASVLRIGLRDAARPSTGQIYGEPREIRSYVGDALNVSDLVLAEPVASLGAGEAVDGSRRTGDAPGAGAVGWQRGEVALDLVPMQQYAGGEFSVFYEVYGLDADRPYRTEVHIEPTGGGVLSRLGRLFGSDNEVRLRFEERAPEGGGVIAALRRVDTELEAGRYRLTVTIEDDVSGEAVVRSREFTIPE